MAVTPSITRVTLLTSPLSRKATGSSRWMGKIVGWMDGWMVGWMDGCRMDGWMNGLMEEWRNG